jgi:hypothetical protein
MQPTQDVFMAWQWFCEGIDRVRGVQAGSQDSSTSPAPDPTSNSLPYIYMLK